MVLNSRVIVDFHAHYPMHVVHRSALIGFVSRFGNHASFHAVEAR